MQHWRGRILHRLTPMALRLAVEDGYIVDPNFDYCETQLPTFRELHSLEGLGPKALKVELDNIYDEIEHLITDRNNWSVDEVAEWLDSEVELHDLGAWAGMKYSPYGPALEIYQQMDYNDANDLGLILIEGPHP